MEYCKGLNRHPDIFVLPAGVMVSGAGLASGVGLTLKRKMVRGFMGRKELVPGGMEVNKMLSRICMDKNRKGYILIALPIFLFLADAGTIQAATHYFSQSQGSDSNSGDSEASPWKTIAKASAECGTGDTCYFKRGDTWADGVLVLNGNATVVDAYGTGSQPHIDRTGNSGNVNFAVRINGSGIVIQNMKLTAGAEESNEYATAVYGSAADAILRHCTVINNAGTPGAYNANVFGIGRSIWGVAITVTDCVIQVPNGGGIMGQGLNYPYYADNTIYSADMPIKMGDGTVPPNPDPTGGVAERNYIVMNNCAPGAWGLSDGYEPG